MYITYFRLHTNSPPRPWRWRWRWHDQNDNHYNCNLATWSPRCTQPGLHGLRAWDECCEKGKFMRAIMSLPSIDSYYSSTFRKVKNRKITKTMKKKRCDPSTDSYYLNLRRSRNVSIPGFAFDSILGTIFHQKSMNKSIRKSMPKKS